MHLIVDAREIGNPQKTGKGLWTEHLVRTLIERGIPVTLFTDSPLPEGFPRPGHVTIRRLLQTGLRWHLAVARLLRATPDSIYFSPTSFIVPFLVGTRVKTAIVVHDMIAFRNEPHDWKATCIERMTLGRAARTARWIFTISDSTTNDLCARFPSLPSKKITTIFAGPIHSSHSDVSTGKGQTILCPGTLCPRKNQHRLLQAYAQLPDALRTQHQLVLAGGRGWNDDDIVALAHATPGVHRVGYVPDAELERLYADALIVAVPSLYEGFGLPVLTAMQRGIPVLTSNRGSLNEVAGDAALVVDPEDVAAISNGLMRLLTDAALRETLSQKGVEHARRFSWEKTADLLLACLSGTR